jgi:hypothetical protein
VCSDEEQPTYPGGDGLTSVIISLEGFIPVHATSVSFSIIPSSPDSKLIQLQLQIFTAGEASTEPHRVVVTLRRVRATEVSFAVSYRHDASIGTEIYFPARTLKVLKWLQQHSESYCPCWVDVVSIPAAEHSLSRALEYMGDLYAAATILVQPLMLNSEPIGDYYARGWTFQEYYFPQVADLGATQALIEFKTFVTSYLSSNLFPALVRFHQQSGELDATSHWSDREVHLAGSQRNLWQVLNQLNLDNSQRFCFAASMHDLNTASETFESLISANDLSESIRRWNLIREIATNDIATQIESCCHNHTVMSKVFTQDSHTCFHLQYLFHMTWVTLGLNQDWDSSLPEFASAVRSCVESITASSEWMQCSRMVQFLRERSHLMRRLWPNPTCVNEFHTDAGFVDAMMKFLWLQCIPDEVLNVIVINCLKSKRKSKWLGSDGDAGAQLEIELRNAWVTKALAQESDRRFAILGVANSMSKVNWYNKLCIGVQVRGNEDFMLVCGRWLEVKAKVGSCGFITPLPLRYRKGNGVQIPSIGFTVLMTKLPNRTCALCIIEAVFDSSRSQEETTLKPRLLRIEFLDVTVAILEAVSKSKDYTAFQAAQSVYQAWLDQTPSDEMHAMQKDSSEWNPTVIAQILTFAAKCQPGHFNIGADASPAAWATLPLVTTS